VWRVDILVHRSLHLWRGSIIMPEGKKPQVLVQVNVVLALAVYSSRGEGRAAQMGKRIHPIHQSARSVAH
jgi:hypothetical protein